MKNKLIYLVILLIVIIPVSFLLWSYVFSIYEVDYNINPNFLVADGQSILEIVVVPLNSFGNKAPLRSVDAEFQIIKGKELVEILNTHGKDLIKLQAKESTGKILIKLDSKYSQYPTQIEIPIKPNLAQNNSGAL